MKMIDVNGIVDALGVSQNTAYKIIRQLNSELRDSGCRIIQGRVNEEYFRQVYFDTPRRDAGDDNDRD